jgi:hypothetical protein
MKNPTTPMDDNGDDSFDWHDSLSDEEWEECVRGALSDEPWVDPYLQGGHYEANEHMEGESW